MPILFRDYETFSTLDLGDVGAWRYATHPTTGVWCVAFAVDDGPIELWTPGDPIPAAFVEAARNPAWLASAFNSEFERNIERYIMGSRYGFPLIPLERQRCTQASTLMHALPRRLENVALALNLPQEKDTAGAKVMKEFAVPRKPRPGEDPDGGPYWCDDPVKLRRLYAYCRQDVATEREVYRRLGFIPEAEQEVWQLDAQINDRGFPVDRELVNVHSQERAEGHGRPRPSAKGPLGRGAASSGGVAGGRPRSSDDRVRGTLAYHGARTGNRWPWSAT